MPNQTRHTTPNFQMCQIPKPETKITTIDLNTNRIKKTENEMNIE